MNTLSDKERTQLYDEVYPVAQQFRQSFISEQEIIEDTFRTIEQLGYLLLRFPALDDNISLGGFTIYKQPYHCIYINSRHNLGRQYMSCWHECYHIYTGEGNGISYIDSVKQDPIEYKADVFAGMILMPDKLVQSYIQTNNLSPDYLSYEEIIRMQNYFKVGYSAMLTRLIQIYPKSKRSLGARFAIAGNTPDQRAKLEDKTRNAGGDLQLINATNDIYIPDSFINDIEFNVQQKRISTEKAYELLSVIENLNSDL